MDAGHLYVFFALWRAVFSDDPGMLSEMFFIRRK